EPPGGGDGAEAEVAADSAIAGIQPTAASHQHPGEVPAGAARVLLDAALASLVGGLAFIVTVWPQGASFSGARRLLWGSAIAAAVASFGLAVIQHAAASGLGIAAALAPRHLWQSLQFSF